MVYLQSYSLALTFLTNSAMQNRVKMLGMYRKKPLLPIIPSPKVTTPYYTVVDCFQKPVNSSRYWSCLLPSKHLCNYMFRFYGLLENIVSDRGPQFISLVWAAFFQQLNINVSLTSGYYPQSNVQTELRNYEKLRSYYLLWAEYPQNSLCKPWKGLIPS